jgi:hypothetical protein
MEESHGGVFKKLTKRAYTNYFSLCALSQATQTKKLTEKEFFVRHDLKGKR